MQAEANNLFCDLLMRAINHGKMPEEEEFEIGLLASLPPVILATFRLQTIKACQDVMEGNMLLTTPTLISGMTDSSDEEDDISIKVTEVN